MNSDFKDRVFSASVRERFETDLIQIGNSLSVFLKRYAFLFQDDYGKFMSVVLESYIHNYDSNINQFLLDFDNILKEVPNETKERILEQIIMKISKTINVIELNNKEEKANVFNSKNDNNEKDEKGEPSLELDDSTNMNQESDNDNKTKDEDDPFAF